MDPLLAGRDLGPGRPDQRPQACRALDEVLCLGRNLLEVGHEAPQRRPVDIGIAPPGDPPGDLLCHVPRDGTG